MKTRLTLALLLVARLASAYTLTPLLSLKKPAIGVDTYAAAAGMLNENFDALDAALLTSGGLNGRLVQYNGGHTATASSFTAASVVQLDASQTLTTKTIDTASNTIKVAGTQVTALSGNTGTLMTKGDGSLPNGNLAKFDVNGNAIDSGVAASGIVALPLSDASALIKNSSEATKLARFSAASITTGQTRVFTLPDLSDTVVTASAVQTLTGKTYDTDGSGNVLKIAGQQITSVSGNVGKVALVSGSLTNQQLVRADPNGNLVSAGLALAAKQGSSTTALAANGSFTPGHCLKVGASGDAEDSGAVGCASTASNTFTGDQVMSGANGGSVTRTHASENITLSTSGTTTDSSANLLPANSLLDAVTCRVTTTIATASDWSVGDGSVAARFASANSTLTAGTQSVGVNHLKGGVTADNAGPTQAAAAKLRITTTGTPSAGAVRCDVWSHTYGAPTS